MSYIHPKTEYAPDGSEFYVLVEYPSKICRVQKMIAGPNGKFSQAFDKTWRHHGTWAHAYTDKSLAESDAVFVNNENADKLAKEAEKITAKYYDLVSYIRGERR